MMDSDELTGLVAAGLAAISFGTYGVPMKGEAATRVDVDPLVFQSYKAFTVFATSAILICLNNVLAEDMIMAPLSDEMNTVGSYWTFHKWSFSDFTPWAFVSALLWVPGGTAGVYAIRRAGLAISVGIWSCVIVILSFVWGVVIFGEKQKSALGAVGAVAFLCIGLLGIAYFSSAEVDVKKKGQAKMQQGDSVAAETTPLVEKESGDEASLDFEAFPHSGTCPHSHQTVDLHLPAFPVTKELSLHISKYHLGLFMAVINGVFAATIMVPLQYAPPNTTQGIGYSMSFGIAAVLVVLLFWVLRFLFLTLVNCIFHSRWAEISNEPRRLTVALQIFMQILTHSLIQGYNQLPSFHIREMWRPGLTSGVLYSMGNLFGIVSIQNLGDFMGYSLGQSSMIISGLWGLFYYREIPGAMNMIGFLLSSCVVFVGILLMATEHNG
ncbi:hypothetical protein ACHAXR_004730 [Thalassiosira sp. AJA248-18]